MTAFKENDSPKYHDYMLQMIKKIHDAEELLLSGDERHLQELEEISEMIGEYVSQAQGHKFEPAPYRNIQGRPQQGQPSNFYKPYTDFPEYPRMPRRDQDTRAHIGYVPYPSYPFYPFYNEDRRDGNRPREGYNDRDYYTRKPR